MSTKIPTPSDNEMVSVAVYVGAAPGLYSIDEDVGPESWQVKVPKEFLERYRRYCVEHKTIMRHLARYHMQMEDP